MFAFTALVCTTVLGLPSTLSLHPPTPDTLRLEVGSPEVDLSRMAEHDARVTVERFVNGAWEPVVEWTNHLKLGDSAGRKVHRWATIGRRPGASGQPATWEMYQTFDATSIAPLSLRRGSSEGVDLQLIYEGRQVRGTRKAGGGAATPVAVELSRAAFPAAASDLVPMAVHLRKGLVIAAPVWQFGMPDVETRLFDVVDRREMTVAGKAWNSWVVEERAVRDGAVVFIGTWYIVDEAPYMIYAEVVGPGGVRQRMTEVPLERP